MQSFIFGANQEAKTPEELAKRRSVQDALVRAALSRTPQNVGEGLSQMGQAIAYRIMANKNNAAEKAGRESADQAFGGIDFSSLFGGGATAYPSAVAGGASPTSGAATGTTPTTGVTVDLSGDKQKFIDTLLPAAIEHGQRIGVDPRIIVAQAAQETGWGKSAPGNNFFGIKSHGQGGGQNLTTHEVINGQRVKINDSFRTFASPQDSVAGYADFIGSNKRYRPMREAQGLDAQLQALGASGYATDPNYARSVGAIARSINLPQQTQPQGVQVASLDPSAGLEQAYAPQQQPNDAAEAINMVAPQSPYPEQGQVPPHDFTNNPQLSAGVGMPFQGGQPQPQPPQMASVQPQQQADPKAAIRDALLRQNDMALGGALAPQGQAPQQTADASGAFPPAPTGQPFAGQQGGDARGAMVQKLMQAAQNPWLNDNQRAMVNALLQKQMEQGDPMRQLQMQKEQLEVDALRAKPQTEYGFTTLPDGTVLRTDKRSGNAEPIYSAGQKPTGDMQEYEFAKSQGYQGTFAEYQQSMKKAGANQTNVNVGDGEGKDFYKKLDEKGADMFGTLLEDGTNARSTIMRIDRLDQLLQTVPTGAVANFQKIAGDWGVNTEGLDNIQAAQALINQIVPQQRPAGSGPMSDADLELFKQSVPRIINAPGGNKIIARQSG
ncbi:glycoside hydrolase family 73 protein [Ochrobactrum intermedium]|nr:glycoside hydrolase family 73 protein [Brucella intermedia]NVM43229.1 glycoside hydrolase family 73 protein [Brucella intermedia]